MVRHEHRNAVRNNLIMWAFMAPALAYLFVWKIIPLAYTLFLSFTRYNPLKGRPPILKGAQNYLSILRDPEIFSALGRTLVFMVAATLLEFIFGLIVALFMDTGVKGTKVFRMVYIAPMVVTPAVAGMIWYLLFHEKLGAVAMLLRLFGVSSGLLNTASTSLLGIIITDVWHYTPFILLLLSAALTSIDRDIYEASTVDGANWHQQIFHIKLPQIKGAIISAVILRSMDAFRIYDEIAIMTGGGPGTSTETVSMLIYKQAFKFFNIGNASALVIILLIATMITYIGYMKFVDVN